MSDDKKAKRRVNPALLLGGENASKDVQPALVDTETFTPKRVPVRESFRPPVVEVKKPERKVEGAGEEVRDAGRVDGVSAERVNVEPVVEKPLPRVSPPPRIVKKDVPVAFPRVAPKPKGSDAVKGLPSEGAEGTLGDRVSGSESLSEASGVVGSNELKVSPVGDKPKRQVNPLFLAGEEKEHVADTVSKPERLMRPGFMLPGERVPSRLPSKPEKPSVVPFQKLPEGEVKERSQYSRKIESNVEFEEWNDDTSTDTSFGLGGEVDDTYVEPQYSKAFHLTERDIVVMRFLARYRYAYTDQLARLVDTMPRTITARLRVLEKRGFVRREAITERQYLWTTRKAGNLIVDINFPEIRKGSISYATIAHTIGLGNLGVEFEREAGGKDLLGEGKGLDNWVMPENRWKLGIWGNPDGRTVGEMTVTEREIRQGQMRWRGGRSSKEMRELVSLAAGSSLAPELEEGQEGLFVVYGAGGKGGEHIPDLVIARDRDEDGKPQHIAIELELTPKSNADWRKILRNYRDNGEMYSKIYYFTHRRPINAAIQKVNEEVGLGDRLVIRKYTPMNGKMPFWG